MCTIGRFLLNWRDMPIICIMRLTNLSFSHLYNTHLAGSKRQRIRPLNRLNQGGSNEDEAGR